MLGQGFTERPFIGELRQDFGTAIAAIRGDGMQLFGQESGGAFTIDKATGAKRDLGVRDVLGHHFSELRICNQPLGQIAGIFVVATKGQDKLRLFARINCGFRPGELGLGPMFEDKTFRPAIGVFQQRAVNFRRALHRQLEAFLAAFVEIIRMAQRFAGIGEGAL